MTAFKKPSRTTVFLSALLCMIGAAGIPYSLQAQEFNCEVSVNDRQISGSSYDHTAELATEVARYINENRWTNDRFERHERIRCRIQIVLTDADDQFNFDADVIFNLRRPVYNTMQESTLVLLSDDDWIFNFRRNRSFIRDDLQFDDLTSFIDFYMYMLLGYDYDSFSELGGSPHFERAMDIFDMARTANASGWGRSLGSQRNRYGLITALASTAYDDLRRSYYQYHRLGLDQFSADQETARGEVIEAIERIGDNRGRASRHYLFDIFFDTKYTEIVSLFREAPARQRLEAYNLLRETDPGHSSEYERLR